MEADQHSCILDWPYFYQGKSSEELSQSLLLATLELETTRLRAQEELRMRDDQLNQLKDLLNKAINERDEAQNKCQSLLLEKMLLQQQQQQQQQYHHHNHQKSHHRSAIAPPHSGISSIEDEPINNASGFSSSDCDESIVSSPITEKPVQLKPQPPPLPPQQSFDQELPFPVAPLPDKGKLLEAVMKAGPLLQNLLLAGPLPLWRHPPPPLDTYQIPTPPVVVPTPPPPLPARHLLNQESLVSIPNGCGGFNKKRGFSEGSDSSTETKYQRIALN